MRQTARSLSARAKLALAGSRRTRLQLPAQKQHLSPHGARRDASHNNPLAYGPGTDIGYLNGMKSNGGAVYGGSIFNTALPNQATALPDQLSQTVAPQLTQFTQSLTKADTGLGQFSGGLGDALKACSAGLEVEAAEVEAGLVASSAGSAACSASPRAA
jgi:hypothetical protein